MIMICIMCYIDMLGQLFTLLNGLHKQCSS